MILTFNESAFALDGKTELINQKGELEYLCIYDFSYKNRIRILDNANNELAYIQFKVLSSVDQIGLFDQQDKQIAYTKLDELVIMDDGYKVVSNGNAYSLIAKDNSKVMSVVDNKAIINNDCEVLKCILCLYVFANKDHLQN